MNYFDNDMGSLDISIKLGRRHRTSVKMWEFSLLQKSTPEDAAIGKPNYSLPINVFCEEGDGGFSCE